MTFTSYPVEATVPVAVSAGGTSSTTALVNNRVIVSSAGQIVESAAITASRALVSNSSGIPVASAITTAQLGATLYWTKYSVLYSALSTAALTNDIELFSLPAKGVMHKVIIKSTTAFAGTATYTLSVGITGTLAKYIAAFDVKQAVASTTFSVGATTINTQPENFGSATSIRVAAISTVQNLDQASAGAADIYVLTSLLP